MTVVYPREMQAIDQTTIENGRHGLVLMERAGCQAIDLAVSKWGLPSKALILCGPGNNGGDGLVIARELFCLGIEARILFTHPIKRVSEAFLHQFQELSQLPVPWKIQPLDDFDDEDPWWMNLDPTDWVVDAMLGTGSKGALLPPLEGFLEKINRTNAKKIAIDQPTGIDGYNGNLLGNTAFKADMTVTMGYIKSGLLLYPARAYVGELKVADIGFSDLTVKSLHFGQKRLITQIDVEALLPERTPWGHKGTFGKVLITGGSEKYKGAPVLSAIGACGVGSGLIFLQAHSPIDQIVIPQLPQLITFTMEEESAWIKPDSWAIGMGMQHHEPSLKCLHRALAEPGCSLVLDAYALQWLSENPEKMRLLLSRKEPAVLTPHDMEFARLINRDLDDIQKNRLELGSGFSKDHAVVLVLKGATTLIFTPEGKIWFNVSGNTGLAKGGSGDVLSGMIAGFLAQGLSPEQAAICAVYLHAQAAESYAKAHWEGGFQPSEIMVWVNRLLSSWTKGGQ